MQVCSLSVGVFYITRLVLSLSFQGTVVFNNENSNYQHTRINIGCKDSQLELSSLGGKTVVFRNLESVFKQIQMLR